ncbi:MAG: aminopeptidase P family protein [Chlamydiia bacterium]|nr:aminopeptidase P family protein [Chlamydiia bacterium]
MKDRLERVQKELSVEALLIDRPIDLYYLTGMDLSKGRLLISKKEAILFVDGRYFEAAQKRSLCRVALDAKGALVAAVQPYRNVGIDSAALSLFAYESLQKEIPGKQWHLLPDPLRDLRLIKSDREIALLKKAADLTWKGYRHARSLLKEGVSEEAIAWEFERFCRENGASGMSFTPIVAFGENSAYPHHRAGPTRLKKDQIVLIDVGAVVDHYAGDLTRMVFLGNVDPKLRKMYEQVQQAQREAVAAVRCGMQIGALDRLVRERFKQEGVDALFVHNLGHGIGLETHEYPRIRFDGTDASCLIRPGMVFTIEPGLYQSGLGGIRYEDMILVTDSGAINFYHDEF